ncbi:hypothetical protein, partial [Streptomyces pseudogriseolus]|uniref:hypothetical protein n=1 Tax=Streptomyces pseudogriseolus TaxID=36817 RepID=UPI003FA26DCD
MAVTATPPTVRPETAAPSRAGAAAVTTALVLLVAALAVVDITQGTAAGGGGGVVEMNTHQRDAHATVAGGWGSRGGGVWA